MKNIDAIQETIRKTLTESKRTIATKGIELSVTIPSEDSSTPTIDLSKDDTIIISDDESSSKAVQKSPPSLSVEAPAEKAATEKSKPRIKNDERVRINLERFQPLQSKEKSPVMTKEICDQNSDIMVEMLSKEILEQSKSINKSVPTPDNLKNSDDSLMKSTSQTNVADVIRDTPVRDVFEEPAYQDPNPNYNCQPINLPVSCRFLFSKFFI